MSRDFLEITAVHPVPDAANDGYRFVFTLDGTRGVVRLNVPPECLLDYAAAQRAILVGAAGVFRYGPSEGRPSLAADEQWRLFIDQMLRQSMADADPAGFLDPTRN